MKRLGFYSFFLFLGACSGDEESAQSKAMTLLTDNSAKSWSISEYFIDEQKNDISPCDSSYVLTMESDFTWKEEYTKLYCNQGSNGHWSLNDDGDVITITYIDWSTGQQVERKFEIMELTKENFTYQFPIRNSLKRIRMQVYD